MKKDDVRLLLIPAAGLLAVVTLLRAVGGGKGNDAGEAAASCREETETEIALTALSEENSPEAAESETRFTGSVRKTAAPSTSAENCEKTAEAPETSPEAVRRTAENTAEKHRQETSVKASREEKPTSAETAAALPTAAETAKETVKETAEELQQETSAAAKETSASAETVPSSTAAETVPPSPAEESSSYPAAESTDESCSHPATESAEESREPQIIPSSAETEETLVRPGELTVFLKMSGGGASGKRFVLSSSTLCMSAVTNGSGKAVFPDVLPGIYLLQAEYEDPYHILPAPQTVRINAGESVTLKLESGWLPETDRTADSLLAYAFSYAETLGLSARSGPHGTWHTPQEVTGEKRSYDYAEQYIRSRLEYYRGQNAHTVWLWYERNDPAEDHFTFYIGWAD